jgi:hypothetical protein
LQGGYKDMSINTISSLKSMLSNDSNIKICILDNNMIEVLTRTSSLITQDRIFNQYDIIIIPGWVYEEIRDSDVRVRYVNALRDVYNLKVYIIEEKDYSELVDFKEADLFYIFIYSCHLVTNLIGFINRNIINTRAPVNKIIEELPPYEEWMDKLYNEGFESKVLANGRIQKKNAGEISICVLANILSIYYEKFENITIFSFDGDTYNFISKSEEKLLRDEKFTDCLLKPVTYKSNDVLIYEWLRQGLINEAGLESIVNRIRQSRRVKYTKQAPDLSIEEHDEILDNDSFCQLILQGGLHIIF